MNVFSYQSADDEEIAWQRIMEPPCLVCRGGNMMVELPSGCRGYVNGLPVIGVQVVQPGDLVRIATADDSETNYVVGRPQPLRECGAGQVCAFTGLPINGEAIRCACGSVYCCEVLEQLDVCPHCDVRLRVECESVPAEELR